MSYLVDNQQPDWALVENIKERRTDTHIPRNAADDALTVTLNTGTLGDGRAALSLASGSAVVDGQQSDINQQTVDVDLGDSQPRRDVVYVTDAGTVDVLRGTQGGLAWGEGVASTQETPRNAARPAPRSFADVTGLPVAVITVPGNGASSLPSDERQAIRRVRVREQPTHAGITETSLSKPGVNAESDLSVDDASVQSSLDGRVVPVGEGLGSGDAIDPAATTTPVQDAYDIAKAAGGQGAVLLPPSTVHEDATIVADTKNCSILGWGNRSVINYDGGSGETILKVVGGGNSDFLGFQVFGVGEDVAATAPAIHVESSQGPLYTDGQLGNIWILNHRGQALKGDGGLFACQFGPFRVGQVDAGDVPALFHFTGGLEIGLKGVNAYPVDTTSGSPSTLLEAGGISMTVKKLNGGGTMGTMINANASLDVRSLNYEPEPVVGSGHTVVDIQSTHPTHLSNVTVTTGDIDTIYRLRDGAGNARLPQPHLRPGISAGPADIGVIDGALDSEHPVGYAGLESDWRGSSPDFFAFDTIRRAIVVGPRTADYTVSHGEYVLFDTSSNSATAELPPAVAGRHVGLKNTSSTAGNQINITTPSGGTIDGNSSASIGTNNASEELVCDGTDWWTV
ncbi:hypothetical protein [Halococcus saccharolyticus]|uniref:Uncharacterized protein n=1 Tax=Halococcus saccharolyticus DSM 5350 TaxID=1227455 RepID=M0MA40_9EURY|nr:hypothetical protein [Halococcus saccharolyticus]EMA42652.1 hypothetical protein C449_15958 [Halococcus saccharolyticus DSM 5350]